MPVRRLVAIVSLCAAACGGGPDPDHGDPDADPIHTPDAEGPGGPTTVCANDPAPEPTTGEVQTLLPTGPDVWADFFGQAVAATDDVIVVGAPYDGHYGDNEPGGSISVFESNPATGMFKRVAYFLGATEY